MKKMLSVILAAVMVLSACGCAGGKESSTAEPAEIAPIEDTFEHSYEAVANMRIGWNLGNSLDSSGDIHGTMASTFEKAWGNPVTTPELIAAVKDAGFGAVRIPVTWYCNMDENGTVNDFWLDRVEEVVNYVLDEGMYAIINVHHDTGGSESAWLRADPDMYDNGMSDRYVYLWQQIAERFKDYDERLLFESFNEILDSNFNWNGSGAEEYDTVNRLNQLFVDTIRATGGNNAYRNIIVNSYGASTAQSQVDGFVVPTDSADKHLIAEMHCYDPGEFTSRHGDTTWDPEDREVLEVIFERINRQVIEEQGVPMIIGEFGAQDADNESEIALYAADFVSIAKKYGITCFWWDDGGMMDIFNRIVYIQTMPEIIEAMMNAIGEE